MPFSIKPLKFGFDSLTCIQGWLVDHVGSKLVRVCQNVQGDSNIPGSKESLDDLSVDIYELLRNANPRTFFGHSNFRSVMGTSPEMDFACDSGSEPYQRN